MQLAPDIKDQVNRRRSERIHTQLAVRYGRSSMDLTGHAENVSEGGLYVLTNQVFKVGSVIQMVIEFEERGFQHQGEVMWAIAVPDHMKDSLVHGMGVQFVNPDPSWPAFFTGWRKEVLASRGESS